MSQEKIKFSYGDSDKFNSETEAPSITPGNVYFVEDKDHGGYGAIYFDIEDNRLLMTGTNALTADSIKITNNETTKAYLVGSIDLEGDGCSLITDSGIYLDTEANSFTIGSRKTESTIGEMSFTQGRLLIASGYYSHAEGQQSEATGDTSHAEGVLTVASGPVSHAEGRGAKAQGYGSHAEGNFTIASGSYQTVMGKYNIADTTSLLIVGNGTDEDNRSNALLVNSDYTETEQINTNITNANIINIVGKAQLAAYGDEIGCYWL